jgi:hypothetical protein
VEPLEDILFLQHPPHGFVRQGDKMDYRRYIEGRIIDIGYTKARLQRLFSVLSDADYDALQKLLEDAESILKKYIVGGNS